jgi:restriction endonuclease Mrr
MSICLNDSEKRQLRRKARAAILNALRDLGGEARRQELIARALADGGFTRRELAACPPRGARAQYERLVDQELSWLLTSLKRDGLLEKPKWGTWRLAGAARETPAKATEGKIDGTRVAELRAMSYRDYLHTSEWRRTRAAALQRAGNCCSLDVTHTEGLEVHHRSYERLAEELASDVVVLCHACHRLYHEQYGLPRRKESSEFRPVLSAATRPSSVKVAQKRERSWLRRLMAG